MIKLTTDQGVAYLDAARVLVVQAAERHPEHDVGMLSMVWYDGIGAAIFLKESPEEVARLVDEATRPVGLHRGSPSEFMRTLREAADAENVDYEKKAWEAECRRKGTGEILMGGGNGL